MGLFHRCKWTTDATESRSGFTLSLERCQKCGKERAWIGMGLYREKHAVALAKKKLKWIDGSKNDLEEWFGQLGCPPDCEACEVERDLSAGIDVEHATDGGHFIVFYEDDRIITLTVSDGNPDHELYYVVERDDMIDETGAVKSAQELAALLRATTDTEQDGAD